ncbi:hypothetical protein AB0I28_34100 [Phytomonospora sp. NPDC050363]|uniref:hypothetical protein n=1 Tax=Phytomonospora sp. NPDC050363 TaxID=3155642 RepID=UPI0033CA3080
MPPIEWTWPCYVADVWRRTEMPVVLIVICPTDETAAWAGRPIEMGPRAVVVPAAIAPSRFPVITGTEDVEEAEVSVEVAVFSAYMHADGPHGSGVLRALMASLDRVDVDAADNYIKYLEQTLSADPKALLEVLMSAGTYEFQTYSQSRYAKGMAEGEAKGEIKGEIKAILTVLGARGIEVPDEVIKRVESCQDLRTLQAWLIRAATVSTAEAIFG